MITPFFPTKTDYKGIYIYDQVKEIQKQTGFNIQIIKVVSFFSNETDYMYDGFNVIVIKILDLPFFIFPGLFNYINRFRVNSLIEKKGIFNIRYIHAHVTYPSAYLANMISDKTEAYTIVQHHGIDILQLNNGRINFIRRLQASYLIKKSIKELNNISRNIGVSKRVINELQSYKDYNPKMNEYIFYNGVDTSKFYPLKVKKNNEFIIGCVANFYKIKDHITLIKAVHYLSVEGKKIKLRLIGSGPTLTACYNYVHKHNLASIITFESEKAHNELNVFYNEIDLFVLPSFYEALGCVYLESWATNTPFIGIQGQGIAEVISKKQQDVYLAKANNLISLKECITTVMDSNNKFLFDKKYDIRNTVSNFLNNCII